VALQVEQGSAGLPVGVQVVARPWMEHIALAAMAAVEGAVRARASRGIEPSMQTGPQPF
jgi:fatty acid amide hydrolase